VTSDAEKIQLQWGVKIPLRDGVKLDATVYLPRNLSAPTPCVFTLTPYISQSYCDFGIYFAARGFPFVTVDVRGRGNSEGEFRPIIQEARDGYDVVEWLAEQPFCNGKVAMWGGSYAGYVQWAAAKEFPPNLATIVPVASAQPGVDFPMRNNIRHPYAVQWLTFVSGRALQDKLFANADFWTAKSREWFVSGRALRTLDTLVGNPLPIFQEWLSQPEQGPYWDAYNPTPEQYANIDLPILTITGSYDDDQPGALSFYEQHMRYGNEKARERHYLIIGPWDHAGTRIPSAEVGGLKFGAASLIDLGKLHTEWYAWTMQSGPRPEFLKNKVAYYIAGAEEWRYADSLEAITAETRALYLVSRGGAIGNVFRSGTLEPAPPSAEEPARYLYDPRDTSLCDIESAGGMANLGDQREILACENQLVYHSRPFESDTEISGFFRLLMWIAIDQPDTDFLARIFEILPDGSSVALSSDLMRARYRKSLREPQLVTKGDVLQYDFKRFTFISRLLRKGSRLRLVFGPVNAIGFDKNYNSGGAVADETFEDAHAVNVTVYNDALHQSALYVPVGAKDTPKGGVRSMADIANRDWM
jgi:putative CocE/NonD family hydrolase